MAQIGVLGETRVASNCGGLFTLSIRRKTAGFAAVQSDNDDIEATHLIVLGIIEIAANLNDKSADCARYLSETAETSTVEIGFPSRLIGTAPIVLLNRIELRRKLVVNEINAAAAA